MAVKKLVGKVTPEECREIQQLFERRNGLRELELIVKPSENELYDKMIQDMGETNTKYQVWWDRMGKKYQWESVDNGRWKINFDTCDIFLVTE